MMRARTACAVAAAAMAWSAGATARQMYQSPQMLEEMRQEQAKLQAEMARVRKAASAAQAALAKENAAGPKTPLGKIVITLDFTRSPDAALTARAKLAEQ